MQRFRCAPEPRAMDNVTHSLTGLALARIGLRRFSPHATALLVLSANAPDIDIVALSRGSLAYFEAHRGYTHSVIFLPLLALASVLAVAAVSRRGLPWLNAWILCSIGVASHLLIDWTNSYGVRLLLPFSSRWFHLDLNSLYDGSIMAALVFAAIWPLFSRLVSREIGDRPGGGRGVAVFALVFFVVFDFGRAVLHGRVIAQLESRLYDDAPAVTTAALPAPFSPFRWTGVVETARAYERMDVNTLGELDTADAQIFYKIAQTPAYVSAKATQAFAFFLYFARFPVWSEESVQTRQGPVKRIAVSDLRFGTPESGSFHCFAIENDRNQVLRSGFAVGLPDD